MDENSPQPPSRSTRTSLGSTSRLSFTGSIRLNDLINEDNDDYGFDTTPEIAEEKKIYRQPSSNYIAELAEADKATTRGEVESPDSLKAVDKAEYDRVYESTCQMYDMMRSIGFVGFQTPEYKPPN